MAIVEAGIPRPRVLMKPPIRLLGVVNPTVNRLLCSRLHGLMSDVLVILHFRGRRSGRVYDLPVGYASDGQRFYISTDKRWCQNLRGGQRIEVTHRRQRMPAVADVIDDPDAMAEAYRAMYTLGPRYATRLGNFGGFAFGLGGEVHLGEVMRVRDAGHVIVFAAPEPWP
jgi:hypothetical protein